MIIGFESLCKCRRLAPEMALAGFLLRPVALVAGAFEFGAFMVDSAPILPGHFMRKRN